MTDGKGPDFKAEARAEAFARRAVAHAAGQGQAAEILADFLASHAGKVLSGYMPMRTEIDPLPAMAAHRGPVGVPVIMAKATPLKFREWSPGCRLVEGAFKALIPEDGAWVEPEVMIVPLLAWDARGYRLGYGGGYFDRTLARLAPRPFTIGIGLQAAQLSTIFPQPHDIPLDVILTEAGVQFQREDP